MATTTKYSDDPVVQSGIEAILANPNRMRGADLLEHARRLRNDEMWIASGIPPYLLSGGQNDPREAVLETLSIVEAIALEDMVE